MKKQELLNYFDDELMEKLFAFCYARTKDSYEAQELCSDIIFALVKAANTEGEVENPYPFIWRVARNVYADFSGSRRWQANTFYQGDADELLTLIAEEERDDNDEELLRTVYYRISFLTRAYREVMIMFYLDGMSTAEIARHQEISETAVRQRLFAARQKVRDEVEEMEKAGNRPVALDKINYIIWGTGEPGWGDPRNVCTRQFSKHILWLCYKRPMTPGEIAEELHVPTLYVEEELEILACGENGKYGLLRRLDNGRSAINFILFSKEEVERAHAIYTEQLPAVCNIIYDFVMKYKEEYLAFPYLNQKTDLNLILWQQVSKIANSFSGHVERILAEKYFAQMKRPERPFSVFGYVDNGKSYGGGWDSVYAENVCGYAKIYLDNIYITRIKKHFNCGLNVAGDPEIQLALRAVEGLDINVLSEAEKEHAAKAIECGYLYRDGEMLYTKILVCDVKDKGNLFAVSNKLGKGYFEEQAQLTANKLFEVIRCAVPDYLLGEWRLANILASMPVLDALVEALIEKGMLIPPKDGVGAEGCWMCVGR